MLISTAVLINLQSPAYGQTGEGGFTQPSSSLPPGWDERAVVLYFNATHLEPSSSGANHTIIDLMLYDRKNSKILENVTYGIRITDEKYSLQSIISDTFLSRKGPLTLDFEHTNELSENIILAAKDPVLSRWEADSNGKIPVRTPFVKPGDSYYLQVSILGAEDSGNDLYPPEVVPVIDLFWNKENITLKTEIPEFPATLLPLVMAASFLVFFYKRRI
ncbi:hypothetical protein [Nitrososphaera sp.]|uniref:hypothetical protein n=1 Tax=Nitrososphaera sp. TaxID=1971748 RepID=UPI00307D29A2